MKRISYFPMYIIFVLLVSSSLTAEWPQFRGNTAQTGVASDKLLKSLKLLWSYDTGAEIGSTPALTNTSVHIGTEGKKFLSLDILTGKKKWEFFSKGEISSSALVLEGKVFFGDEMGYFYALDEVTGKEIWRFEEKDKIILIFPRKTIPRFPLPCPAVRYLSLP